MKTLIYHTGALGDFVTILPALSIWKSQHPDARLTYLGKKAHGDLGRAAGYFGDALDIDRSIFASLFSNSLSMELSALLSTFDSAIAFTAHDSPVANHLGRHYSTLLSQPPFPGSQQHVVDYHMSLFPSWEQEKTARIPRVRISANSAIDRAAIRPTAVIQPGSGSSIKNWPIERFAEVSLSLDRAGCDVLWVMGPAEEDRRPPSGISEIRNQSLPDVCRVLELAAIFIGNDSGMSHLAAACGCACVVLFGPSDAAIWRPLGNSVRIISAIAPCSPCHGVSAAIHHCEAPCMNQISAATVLREAFDILRIRPINSPEGEL